MLFLKFLNKLNPILFSLIKWLKGQKGWFYPILLLKIFKGILSFLVKAEKFRLTTVIKSIYYFLSAFNAVLALIIVFQLTGYTLKSEVIEIFKASLKLFIPVMILEGLSGFLENQILTIKDITRKIINWALEEEKTQSKDIIINPKKIIINQDQFSLETQTDIERIEKGEYLYYEGIENKSNWKAIIFFSFLAIGASYALFPHLYHSIYFSLKDIFYPGGGGGSGDINPNLRPGNTDILPTTSDPKSLNFLKVRVDDVINANDMTNSEKFYRLGQMKELATAPSLNLNPLEKSDITNLFYDARNTLDKNILSVDQIVQTISPTGSEGSLTPTTTGSLTPTQIATTSLTPDVGQIPTQIVTDSLTPIQKTSSLNISTVLPDSNPTGFLQKAVDNIIYNDSLTYTKKHLEILKLNDAVLNPSNFNNLDTQELLKRANIISDANKMLESMKPAPINTNLTGIFTSTDLIKSNTSPVIEKLPDNIDWAKGGKLKGMFTKNTPIINYPIDIPIAHISPYTSGDVSPTNPWDPNTSGEIVLHTNELTDRLLSDIKDK